MSTASLSVLDPMARKGPDVVRMGVIGYGYWGPNVVRNVSGLESCQLVAVCDQNPAALKRAIITTAASQQSTLESR